MSSRRGAALALAALTALGACRGPARERSPGAPAARPNLVLIVIDTLRRDHVSCYGYPRPTTPRIARLAAEGALADAISPTSWTKPAVASIITGLHPLRHQAFGERDRLPQDAVTLAEILKGRGYRTVGVTANGFVGARDGFAQGFDDYVTLPDDGFGRFEPATTVNRVLASRWGELRTPFFLYVHYLDPHAPYEPMNSRLAWELTGRPARRSEVNVPELEIQSFMQRPRALVRDAVDLYDGEIARVDDAVGEIADRLRRSGSLDSTLLVITSDHGEEFEEHGRMGHGQSLYEEVMEVPLALRLPGVIPAGTRHGTVSLLDVLPTCLDLLGMPGAGGGLDGVDQAPSLRSGRPIDGRDRELLLHLDSVGGHYLALRTDGRKLLLGRQPYRKELFDLAADPREQANLFSGERPRGDFATTSGRLLELYRGLLRHSLAPDIAAADRETSERLAALGYVGPAGSSGHQIPISLRAPDDRPGGLLGWEDPASFRSCLDAAEAGADEQLLLGWYEPEERGRWTWPEATAAFRLPAGPFRIRVEGSSPQGDGGRLRVLLDGRRVIDAALEAGPFAVAATVGDLHTAGSVALLRLQRTPGARLAPRIGQTGRRLVGTFVSSICVEPAPATAPRAASR